MAVSIVEVLQPQTLLEETPVTEYVVEIIRSAPVPIETINHVNTLEVVREAGTLINIGAGPELPTNPYEGQIWIKT